MKFFAYGPAGAERTAVVHDGTSYDLSPLTGGATALTRTFLEDDGIERTRRAIAENSLPVLDTGDLPVLDADATRGSDAAEPQTSDAAPSGTIRVGAPLAPGKILCIGLNYRDHAAETNAEIPAEPIVFMKAPDTVVGPYDDVLIPRDSVKTDWEVELGAVIGSTLRYAASPEEALAAVAGYTISNDVSEREFQIERGGTWDKGKNCETFNPMGPYLVTADEISDVQDLSLTLSVNGESRQDGTTADQIFGVGEVLAYLSRFMTLYPSDLVNTGTPAGVAMGLPGQPYLRDGDVVELAIEGLGSQRQTFHDTPAPTAPATASDAASTTTEKETGR
ncbi:fumarylacetoacetate hydrolase family protein [Brachybacterium halotolerans subsp. kimchii]|uniref:fumarylacetoacetate hydrolase family protein n=1 Tax=Brachybacterium halotolerans TaxID=2795215 RepID=UPI001E36FD7F|nr:fumarylacetoacetate hydrolase family protein [Brachybacterium halotolerans]UEJ81607.1 fumarylacetoacetate hydrolase family protein [Brachybacterium halotolerans subsp. kimchii]